VSSAFQYIIPNAEGDPTEIILQPGQMLFVLGANGTGKSTLLHKITTSLGRRATRLSAHRQVWFHSNSADILSSQRDQSLSNLQARENEDQSRYMDPNAGTRNQILLFDFLKSNESINSKIAEAARSKNTLLVEKLIENESPLQKLNRLLLASNLHFQINFDEHGRYLASRQGFTAYSISELSDGERAALLIILTVLNVEPNSVAILDEPERHLHRSIVSPMLSSLLLERKDVVFIISTHDVSFAIDQPSSKVLLLRDFNKMSGNWTYDVVDGTESIDEAIAQAVLGGRRRILFVEGERSSLDFSIHGVMFPRVSVFPSGSSKNVVHMVRSVTASEKLHRIRAIGLIDGDYLSIEKKVALRSEGIFAFGLNSVESLYYCKVAVAFAARSIAKLLLRDADELIRSSLAAAVLSFSRNRDKLASLVAEARVLEALLESSPSNSAIMRRAIERTEPINVAAIYDEELRRLDELVQNADYDQLIAGYSVKRSGIRSEIAATLGFAHYQTYEECIRTGIVMDRDFASSMRSILEGVEEAVGL
jgi:ABC-type cobalamin/Fe3+-siderophores transport system ATPase subunit